MLALKLLSSETVEYLSNNISAHLSRYTGGDFLDLAKMNGWEIEARFAKWDESIVAKMDFSDSREAEIENSFLVFNTFEGMTPALARDERIWARFCHVEFLEYARARWLGQRDVASAVRKHFFANGLNGCRDDNAIGRLWWNGYIAKLGCPGDVRFGLERLLSRANIRMQVVERSNTAFREPLISGIVRLLQDDWLNKEDKNIELFMKEVNKSCGGLVFEALGAQGTDQHLAGCLRRAKNTTERKGLTGRSRAAVLKRNRRNARKIRGKKKKKGRS